MEADEKSSCHEQLNKIWQKDAQSMSESIQNHAIKTSESKKLILNKILTYLKAIEEKITKNIPLDEIKEVIETVKEFIRRNTPELSVPRGFFSNSGKSVNLVNTLDRILDKLIKTIAANEPTISYDLKK
ncbi:hypothetical protein BEV13_01555 [Rickettsiella grylli]|nr:hypothetical protein BEV13_01555 [Rickettsiella grylli]